MTSSDRSPSPGPTLSGTLTPASAKHVRKKRRILPWLLAGASVFAFVSWLRAEDNGIKRYITTENLHFSDLKTHDRIGMLKKGSCVYVQPFANRYASFIEVETKHKDNIVRGYASGQYLKAAGWLSWSCTASIENYVPADPNGPVKPLPDIPYFTAAFDSHLYTSTLHYYDTLKKGSCVAVPQPVQYKDSERGLGDNRYVLVRLFTEEGTRNAYVDKWRLDQSRAHDHMNCKSSMLPPAPAPESP